MKSYQPKHAPRKRNEQTKTLRPLRAINGKINMSWLTREIDVPKGTLKGWMKRGDNMVETKNHISSDYREKSYNKAMDTLRDLRDEINEILEDSKP